MYSDDTSYLFAHEDENKLENLVNDDMLRVGQWFRINKLTLNESKTRFIWFKSHRVEKDMNVFINGKQIERVGEKNREKSIKLLGLTLDENLSFREHVGGVLSKIRKACFALNSIKDQLRVRERIMIYRSLIESHLLYCIILWGPSLSGKVRKALLILQKRALRSVAGGKSKMHTDPLFFGFKILKFEDLLARESAIWVYKAKIGYFPKRVNDQLWGSVSQKRDILRSADNATIPRNTKETQVTGYMKKVWNSLPEDIRLSESLEIFKSRTMDHFIGNYNETCEKKACYICKRPNTDNDKLLV